jgi:hypothetical protein
MVNQRLLREVLGLTKVAFAPPPAGDMNQLVQVIMEGANQGLTPDQVASSLQQRGVPPEAIQQAFQMIQQGAAGQMQQPQGGMMPPPQPQGGMMPPPQPQGGMMPPPDAGMMPPPDAGMMPPPPPPQEAPPKEDDNEGRLGVLEQKVEMLINLVEDLLNKDNIAKDMLQSVRSM